MNENVKVVFGLIGGLALFLYGMNSMSDALQKAAGEKMKKILEFLTKNPIMGALAATGDFRYLWSQHRYDDDCPADGIQNQ